MTPKQTLQLLKILQQSWPSFPIDPGDSSQGLPGTADTWAMWFQAVDIQDALSAINVLALSEEKVIMPAISDILPIVRGIEKERLARERMLEEERRRRIAAEQPEEFASPERVAEFMHGLHEKLKLIGEKLDAGKRGKNTRGENYFVPNEDYDWSKTFGALDEVRALPKRDETICEAPKEAA